MPLGNEKWRRTKVARIKGNKRGMSKSSGTENRDKKLQGKLEQSLNVPGIQPFIAGTLHKITLSVLGATSQYA